MAKNKPSWDLNDLLNTVNEINVNEADQHGFAPIHYVAGSGGLAIIQELISLGANINLYTEGTPESKPVTPLVVAIKNGQVDAVNLLLKLGADTALQVDGLAPWTYAIRHKTLAPELTSALIVNGADISQLRGIIEKYGAPILAKLEVQVELVEKLAVAVNGGAEKILDEYLDVNYFSKIVDFSPIVNISKAFAACDIESVIAYVKDTRVLDKDKYASNLFAAAAISGPEYIKMMVALSQAGYEINRKDSDGFTPIQKIGTSNVVALSMLFTQGVNPNEIGPDGFNAVHKAILSGSYNTLNLLMENGGNPNLPAMNGENPLMMVMQSRENMSEMFYVLVAHGADVSEFDIEGMRLIAGVSIDPESVDLMLAVKSADSLVLTGNLPKAEGDINQQIYYARLSFFAKKLPGDYKHLVQIKEALSEGRDQLGHDEEMDTFIIICKNIKWKEMLSLDPQSLTIELGKYMQALGLINQVDGIEEKTEELADGLSDPVSVAGDDIEVSGKLPIDPSDDF
jgi:ankyrin repeat protein